MLISLPLNLFTLAAFAIGFIYFATHMGSKEHDGWLGSSQMFLVVAVVVMLLCIGVAPLPIWHMLTGGH